MYIEEHIEADPEVADGLAIIGHILGRFRRRTGMNNWPAPGMDSHTGGKQEVREPSKRKRTESGKDITTRYKRLMHRCSASLDLEAAFKCINLS